MAVHLSQADPGRLASPPSPVDVGVLTAMSMEAGHLVDKLTRVRRYTSRSLTVVEGELEGRVVAVLSSGVGRASARRGVEHLIDGHRPRWIVSAGFAGALDPVLNRNDLVAPRSIVDGSGGVIEADPSPLESVPTIRVVERLLMVDRVVADATEKAGLRERHGADVVDMETYAAAEASRDRGTAFLSLRIISDDARTDLPPEVGRLLNASGGYRVGAALRALWGRPSAIKDIWNLHAHGMEAADRLADGLHVLLRGLP